MSNPTKTRNTHTAGNSTHKHKPTPKRSSGGNGRKIPRSRKAWDILTKHEEIAYDTARNGHVWRPREEHAELENWEAIDADKIRQYAVALTDAKITEYRTREGVRNLLAMYGHETAFNSFLEYVQRCHDKYVCTAHPNLPETLLIDVWGIADTEYHREVCAAFLCGVVLKQMGEFSQRITPTLCSAQSVGKSTFVGALLPPFLRPLAKLNMRLQPKAQRRDDYLEIQGTVLFELAELSGAKTDNDHLKGFLTATRDSFVPKHANENVERIRRSSAIITMNTGHKLPHDVSGHSRFGFIELPEHLSDDPQASVQRVVQFLNEWRDTLWAQVWERVETYEGDPNELMQLSRAELATQRELTREAAYDPNPEIGRALKQGLAEALGIPKTEHNGKIYVGFEPVREYVKGHVLDAPTRDQNITTALENAGFRPTQIQIDGKRKRLWGKRIETPEHTPEHDDDKPPF